MEGDWGVFMEQHADSGDGSNVDGKQAVGDGSSGPAPQGFVNHGGCLRFIPLRKTLRGFPSSGPLGRKIFKGQCRTGNGLCGRGTGRWERKTEVVQERGDHEPDLGGGGSGIRTSGGGEEGWQAGEAYISRQIFTKEVYFVQGIQVLITSTPSAC